MRRPLILRIKRWPWSASDFGGTGRIGIRQWIKDYKFTKRMHRSPGYLAAVKAADEERERWKASGERPPTVSVAELLARLKMDEP